MVKFRPTLDSTFAALADPTRRAILARLAHGDASVSALAEPFAMTLPAVLKHVRALEGAGLIERAKTGRTVRCRLNAAPLREASDWMSDYRQFWQAQFAALAGYLGKPQD